MRNLLRSPNLNLSFLKPAGVAFIVLVTRPNSHPHRIPGPVIPPNRAIGCLQQSIMRSR